MGFFYFLIDLIFLETIAYCKCNQILDECVKSHHYWFPTFYLLCFCSFFNGCSFYEFQGMGRKEVDL